MNFPILRAGRERFFRQALFSLCCLFLSSSFISSAHAQTANLSGLVADPTGAVVRGAEVTFTNERTKTVSHAKTNSAGIYSLPFLQPGQYTLTADASGFKRYERTGVTVEVAQNLDIDVRLQIGETSQSVTVDGSGARINTTDASVSTVIDRQFVENIPLNGRSFQSLLTMVPGVLVVPTANTSSGAGYSGEITVNGQRTEANYFTVDGVSVNTGVQTGTSGYGGGYSGSVPGETALGTTQSLASIDALQEFRATTSTYSAEYGRTPGGQFVFQTRSGTNDWHGSAFEYFRNDALDANNYFNKRTTPITPRQAERQNDFGGTLGGPIRIPGLYDGKDRSFFFFSYEGLRLHTPQAALLTEVPNLSLRSSAPTQLQPFLNAFPKPNGADLGNGLADFTGGYSAPSSVDTTSVRIDHHFGDKFQIFGRYSDTPSDSQSRGTTADMAVLTTQSVNMQSLTLGATNTFLPSLTSDLRFNFTWNHDASTPTTDDYGAASPLPSAFLTSIPGYAQGQTIQFQLLYGDFDPSVHLAPTSGNQHQINVVEVMNASIGRHSLKWGLDYRRIDTQAFNPNFLQQGVFKSSTQVTNNQTSSVYTALGPSQLNPVYSNLSLFIQDEWKATSRLSLSLGIRWDFNPAPRDADGNNPYTVTSTDFSTAQLEPQNSPLWRSTYLNFAPRFGAAYQIHQQPGFETVVRVGGGLFYDTGNTPYGSVGYAGQGLTTSTTFTGTPFPLSQAQIATIPVPTAAAPYESEVIGFDPNLKAPYTWQWNLALEQALGREQTLTLSYVGSAGRQLLYTTFGTPQGNPNFGPNGTLQVTTNGASADYDALQVQFQRKMNRGLQALASYTWSHAFDNDSSNFLVHELIRSASDNDVRNNFQLGFDYELPSRYNNRWLAMSLKDWALDARVSSRSALPVDVQGAQGYLPELGIYEYYQPNRVSGQPLYLYGPQYPGGRVINFAAYQKATDSAGNPIEGNAGRNSARGFGATQADIALNRTFPISEKVRLQFRVEGFNIFNQALMGTIYPQISSGLGKFGYAYRTENYQLGGLNSLYQVGGPRSLQIALRLHF